jgi:hypothetical protein
MRQDGLSGPRLLQSRQSFRPNYIDPAVRILSNAPGPWQYADPDLIGYGSSPGRTSI